MRLLLIILGCFAVTVGVAGIFLPVLPTTPFILVAAYFFSKSSDTFYLRLVSIPAFGKMIDEWNSHGIIPMKTKIIACTSITAVLCYFWIATYPVFVQAMMTAILISTAGYVLCQPSEQA